MPAASGIKVELCVVAAMALRVVFIFALLLFCTAKVSSDSKTEEDAHHVSQALNFSSDSKIEEDAHHVSQALRVFTKGANRNLLQDIVVKLSKYMNNGHSLALSPAPAPAPITANLDCGGLCKHRCSLHSRPNVCLRACGTCCVRCKCVPPGTYGNRELCGRCYTDMTTHGNKPKCP